MWPRFPLNRKLGTAPPPLQRHRFPAGTDRQRARQREPPPLSPLPRRNPRSGAGTQNRGRTGYRLGAALGRPAVGRRIHNLRSDRFRLVVCNARPPGDTTRFLLPRRRDRGGGFGTSGNPDGVQRPPRQCTRTYARRCRDSRPPGKCPHRQYPTAGSELPLLVRADILLPR